MNETKEREEHRRACQFYKAGDCGKQSGVIAPFVYLEIPCNAETDCRRMKEYDREIRKRQTKKTKK